MPRSVPARVSCPGAHGSQRNFRAGPVAVVGDGRLGDTLTFGFWCLTECGRIRPSLRDHRVFAQKFLGLRISRIFQ